MPTAALVLPNKYTNNQRGSEKNQRFSHAVWCSWWYSTGYFILSLNRQREASNSWSVILINGYFCVYVRRMNRTGLILQMEVFRVVGSTSTPRFRSSPFQLERILMSWPRIGRDAEAFRSVQYDDIHLMRFDSPNDGAESKTVVMETKSWSISINLLSSSVMVSFFGLEDSKKF